MIQLPAEPRPSAPPYGATAQRPSWSSLPARLRALIEERLGQPLTEAVTQGSGFTNAFASLLLLANGSRAFVMTLFRLFEFCDALDVCGACGRSTDHERTPIVARSGCSECQDRDLFSPAVRPLVAHGLESRPMVGLALRRTLEDHRFVRLASARTISVLGNGFSRVALAFGVLSLPDATPARLSIVLACQAIPQLIFVLVGGVVADRVSRYRLMVGAELLAGFAWLAITAMIFTGNAPLPFLGLAAVVAGVGTALFLPALNGVLPEFVSGERLQSANALLRIGQNSAMVLGLSLSGLVVAAAGAGWALAVNATSFFISAALIWGMKLPARSRAARTSTLAELRHGWAEFLSRQWLWVVVAQFAIVVAAVNATVGVLGPLEMTSSGGGAASWGLLVAAQSLGAIAGAGLATRVQARRPILIAVVATFTFGLPMLALGVGAPLWLVVASMFACGIGSDIFGVLWTTTMQREIPEESMSRVSAYDIFGSLAFAPLGLLLAGPIAAVIGPRAALLGCAGLVTAATLAALTSPAVRRLTAPTLVSGRPRPATETD